MGNVHKLTFQTFLIDTHVVLGPVVIIMASRDELTV